MTTTPEIDKPLSVASAVVTRPTRLHDDEHRPDPDRWKALAVVLAAGFMTLLDVSIVNGHRQRLLQPARGIERRLRVGVPARHRQHRRVRRRRTSARAGGHVHA
jgi:hypothetical protein